MLKENCVYRFKYNKGSRKNQVRTAYVCASTWDTLKTWDFEFEQFRNYHPDGVYEVQPVEGSIVRMDSLPKCLDASEIVEGYREEGKNATYISALKIVVAIEDKLEQDGRITIDKTGHGHNVEFTMPDGCVVYFYTDNNGKGDTCVQIFPNAKSSEGSQQIDNPSVLQVYNYLGRILHKN